MTTLRAIPRALAVLSILAVAACAARPIPIPLAGPPEDIVALAGEWAGEYSGTESHRRGSISFTLRNGDSIAFGEVVMIPQGFTRHVLPLTERQRAEAMLPNPQLLTITFVRVADGRVSGLLDPYVDPDCECMVITTFTGRLTNAKTFEGAFVTRIPGTNLAHTGVWKVKRRTSPRPSPRQ